MAQENEVINLLMGLAALPALLLLLRSRWAPRLPFCFGGLFAILGAYVCTVAEGYLWGSALNLLEHACLAAAGILFCVGVRRLPRDLERHREASG